MTAGRRGNDVRDVSVVTNYMLHLTLFPYQSQKSPFKSNFLQLPPMKRLTLQLFPYNSAHIGWCCNDARFNIPWSSVKSLLAISGVLKQPTDLERAKTIIFTFCMARVQVWCRPRQLGAILYSELTWMLTQGPLEVTLHRTISTFATPSREWIACKIVLSIVLQSVTRQVCLSVALMTPVVMIWYRHVLSRCQIPA